MEFIEAHPDYEWDWYLLSMNPNLTIKFIEEHPQYDWNWEYVSGNPNLTLELLKSILKV